MRRVIAVIIVMASACVALHLSWTAQGVVTIANNPYHFPGPGAQNFTINPQGSSDDDTLDTIDLATTCSTSQWSLDFTVDQSQTLPGARVCGGIIVASGVAPVDNGFAACPANYTFGVRFAGTQPGTSTCVVEISSSATSGSGSGKNVYQLSLTGSGTATGIRAIPTSINFQDVPTATTSSPVPVTVTNLGSAAVSVTGTLSGPYMVTPGFTSFTIPGSSQVTFQVACNMPPLGSQPGSLAFAGGGSAASVALACNGITSSITLNPTQVTFDSTLVGIPPATKSITISGPATATLDMVALDPTAAAAGVTITSNPQGQNLSANRTVTLAYDGAAVHEAGPLGTLMVKASTDPTVRNVGVSGETLVGGVGINPTSVELGAVCAGATGQKTVEVYANEAGTIQLKQIVGPPSPFSAETSDMLPKTLVGNHGGTSANVAVKVQGTTPGDQTGTLTLVTNVPSKEMTDIAAHAVILAGGIAATPDHVSFGSVEPGTTTGIKQVQLTNCGTTDLSFTGAHLGGTNPGEFTIIGGNQPRVLHPTESEAFMLVMQPHSNGLKTAQLIIEHSDGMTIADLDGTGFNGATKERETYYACSTGKPAAALPIALALLLLRRRKHRHL